MRTDYLTRKAGGRGQQQVKQTFEGEERSLYSSNNSTTYALKAIFNEELLNVNKIRSNYNRQE